MNEERLNKLRELFPDWFTQEGYLDINEVKKAVNPNSVEETERYEFRWFGKSAAKRNAFTPTRATLHYDEKRSVNAETTENIIIEGENLIVLIDHGGGNLLLGQHTENTIAHFFFQNLAFGKNSL